MTPKCATAASDIGYFFRPPDPKGNHTIEPEEPYKTGDVEFYRPLSREEIDAFLGDVDSLVRRTLEEFGVVEAPDEESGLGLSVCNAEATRIINGDLLLRHL